MLLKDKINNTSLTKIEKDVADFMVNNINDLENLSTRYIAKITYTSPSAIIRLSQKLGYDGYNDLRKRLIEEKRYIDSHFEVIDPNIPFKNEDSMMKVANIISELMIESSKDTLSLIAHDELQKASDILMKSQHIYIFGFGAYVPLAKIFQLKMSRIKKHVIVQDFIGEENYQVDMVSNNDCAIIVSYSGENETLINVTKQLKDKDISIIAFTSIGENSLSNLCNCILNISTREKIFSKIANYSSEYSVNLIFDILYSLCFKDDYSFNLDYKIKHSKKVESTHFSTNTIIKE